MVTGEGDSTLPNVLLFNCSNGGGVGHVMFPPVKLTVSGYTSSHLKLSRLCYNVKKTLGLVSTKTCELSERGVFSYMIG